MGEVLIVGMNGRRMRVSGIRSDADHGWTYSVDLQMETARGGAAVYDYGEPGLPAFFADLAARWRGFPDEREYTSLEDQLSLRATHDGMGTVTCLVRLRQPSPPTWSMEAELDLGAGAQMECIASELAAAFSGSKPAASAE